MAVQRGVRQWVVLVVPALWLVGRLAYSEGLPDGLVERDGKIIREKDGMEMVRVPAGEFIMGSNDGDDERPVHKVYLDEYYIDKFEVTVAQFKRFCAAARHKMPDQPDLNKDNHPVVKVSWHDAVAYAKWAGASLPTEAQWEKAARGTDGRTYPWGMEWDRSCCNSASYWAKRDIVDLDAWRSWWKGGGKDTARTTEVGHFQSGASPYGCLDMAGNVWEWCADRYDDGYYSKSPDRNPTGPRTGERRVLRGGSWSSITRFVRSAVRGGYLPGYWYVGIGFRCAVASR